MWDDLLDEPGLDEPGTIPPPPMILGDLDEHVAVPARPDERTASPNRVPEQPPSGPSLPDTDQPTEEMLDRLALASPTIPHAPVPHAPVPHAPSSPPGEATYHRDAPRAGPSTSTPEQPPGRHTVMPRGQAPWGSTLPPEQPTPFSSGASAWRGAPGSPVPPTAAPGRAFDIPPEHLAHGYPSGGWPADSGTSSGHRKMVARSVAAATPRAAAARQRSLRDDLGTSAVIAASLSVIVGGLALAAWLVLRTDSAPLLRPIDVPDDPHPPRADAPAGNFAAPPAILPTVPQGSGWTRGRVDDATPEERIAAAESADAVMVDFVSMPGGVLVDVGGRPLGRTPTSIKLAPGPHIVTFKPQGMRAIIRVVQGGTPSIVDIELPADARRTELLITSPGYHDAAVRVDGRRVGNAPLIVDVDGGMHVVELIPPGSAPIRQDIYARAESVTRIAFER